MKINTDPEFWAQKFKDVRAANRASDALLSRAEEAIKELSTLQDPYLKMVAAYVVQDILKHAGE